VRNTDGAEGARRALLGTNPELARGAEKQPVDLDRLAALEQHVRAMKDDLKALSDKLVNEP
jgi:hypothetical protein